MKIIFMILFLVTFFMFTRNLLLLLFSMENYDIHKKRLKQLQFQKKEEADVSEIIDTVTKPVITYILPKLKPRNLKQLEIDLRMAKWDKYFTPIQYRALNILLKIIGTVFFLLLVGKSKPMAFIWALVLFFGMGFLFNNSIKERKEKLVSDFPDFIRITEGYLGANMPLVEAVYECTKFVGEEWQPILRDFVSECQVNSIDEGLDFLKNEVDLFEVREFVALIRLTLEQGGDAKESFRKQADKVREMQMDAMMKKIGKRQMMGVAIQAPLLLCALLVFGLPTIASMVNFSSM